MNHFYSVFVSGNNQTPYVFRMLAVNNKICITLWYIHEKKMVNSLIQACLFCVSYFEFSESPTDSSRNTDR